MLVHRVKERVAVISRIWGPVRSRSVHVLRVVIGALGRRRRQESRRVPGSERMGMRIRPMECTVHGCPSIICLVLVRRVTVASVTHSRRWRWGCITGSWGTSRISSQHHWFIWTLVWWGWYYTTLCCASCATREIRRDGTTVVVEGRRRRHRRVHAGRVRIVLK